MRQAIIRFTDRYTLTSSGDGLAYSLEDKTHAMVIYVQADDATTFRDELEALEDVYPEWTTDEILECLWDAYSSTAEFY